MDYPTLKEKIAVEIERQKKIESMDITEKILKEMMDQIRQQNFYVQDIKNLYFYPLSNNYFCTSFALGYSFTSTVFEHDSVVEMASNTYLHPIGKYGDCSKDVVLSMIAHLKERVENEGLKTEPYLDGFCVEIF